MSLDAKLQKVWYERPGIISALLLPLSWLFTAAVATRRWAFRVGLLRSRRVARPVIVVGNISVGGTGKTPVVIWLANKLAAQGHRVGIVNRGYGGSATRWPQQVDTQSDPAQVGDEAVLIAQRTGAVVVTGPDRAAAAEQAIAAGADVIISDDGLQHYRLRRDCELAVVDGQRLLGNGRLLPAGPLRERPNRLAQVDLVLLNQRGASIPVTLNVPMLQFQTRLDRIRSLSSGEWRDLDTLRDKQVHVVTGIGHPHAFVEALQAQGLRVPSARVLRDHARLTREDIDFGDDTPVLMTAKDAVKCREFADHRHWTVEATVVFDESSQTRLLECVQRACETIKRE